MKTSKFFVSTLIAAAAMTAPAYADTTVTVGDYTGDFTTVTVGTTAPTDTSGAWWVSGGRVDISSDAFAGGTIILGSGSYVTDGTSTEVTANQLFLQGWGQSAAFDVTSTLVLGASSGESSAGIRFGADGNYAVNVSGGIILGADAIIVGGGTHGSISGNISGNHVLTISNMNSAFTFGMSGASGKTIDIGGLNILGNTTVNLSGYSSAKVGTLSGTATLSIAEGTTLSVGTEGSSSSYSGTLSGAGTLEVLAGAQTFSGTTSVSNISVESGATLTLGGATSISDISVSGNLIIDGGDFSFAGSATFAEGASLALTGVTASSIAGLDESKTGLQSGIDATYTIATGGSVSGLTTSNVTINGAVVTSLATDCKSATISGESVYNIATGDSVAYSDISSDDLSAADLINVAGTLDMGAASSGGASNPATLSAENIIGTGTIKWGNTATTAHYVVLNLSDGFTGTLQLSGQLRVDTWGDLKNVGTVNLDGAWLYTVEAATIGKAVVITDTVRSGTDDAAGVNLYIAGSVTFSESFDASGKIVKVAKGTTTFAGDTQIDTLNISGGTATISGSVSADLKKTGTGTLTLSGSVDSGVLLHVKEGTVTIAVNDQALGGDLTIGSGAKVISSMTDAISWGGGNTAQTVKVLGELELNGRWSMNTNKKLVMAGGTVSGTGAENQGNTCALDYFNGGTISAESGVSSIVAPIRVYGGKTLTVDVADEATLNITRIVQGVASGNAALIKDGVGVLTLDGENTYAGGTTISAGTLVAANASALGAGSVTVAADAKLGLVAGTTVANAGGIVLSNGAKLVIDLSSKASATETFTLDLITGTTITFGEVATVSDSSLVSSDWYELSGWENEGWTSALNYDSASQTLSLTMTIPEPSAFGLLAGVGALALCVSRRRRNRR